MKRWQIRQEKLGLLTNKNIKRIEKNQYKIEYKRLKITGEDLTHIKAKVRMANKEYRVASKNFRQFKAQAGKKRIRKSIKQNYTFSNHQFKEAITSQDDSLNRLTIARRRYQEGYHSLKMSEFVAKGATKFGLESTKQTYHVMNRSYNLMKGNGFTKTPKALSWHGRLGERIKVNKIYQRINKLNQKTQKLSKGTRFVSSPFKRLLRNPFSMMNIALVVIIIATLSSIFSTHVYVQDEYDMTDTWEYFTKLDREKSDSNVMYYSNIDDMLFYINYNFDKVAKSSRLNTNASLPEDFTAVEWLNTFWQDLNGDYQHLKSISDLYKSSEEKYQKYVMSDTRMKQYEDLLDMTNQLGSKYFLMQDLKHFLADTKAEKKVPLVVLRRHGYTSPDTLNATTTFKANAGAFIYAPMSGVVNILDNQLIITEGNDSKGRRVTFYDLENIRVLDGQTVSAKDVIGQVKASSNVDVRYEKTQTKLVAVTKEYSEDDIVIVELEGDLSSSETLEHQEYEYKTKWKSLNIGFYLPNVEYTQTTIVIQNITNDSSKIERARAFVDKIKALVSNATDEGIAVVLGNFDIESGINPKLAEGDHLNPPIGPIDDSSYDDPEWLGMDGPQIYNGRYANILDRGIGLGQWTNTADGSIRHTLLRQYAEQKDKKWYDLDLQIDFMLNGDTPYYREIFMSVITSNESVDVLTERFLVKWEGNPGDKVEQRKASARAWLSYFSHAAIAGQPLGNMQDVRVTSRFGEFRQLILQDGRFYENIHNGIDLVYSDGRHHAPIYTVEKGIVVIAGVISGGGNSVVVKHDTFYSHYYHLSDITVSLNQEIEVGTQIGTMGTTGNSTGVHLHLGFSRQMWSDYFDPEPSLDLNK